jgi:hypothetical protein
MQVACLRGAAAYERTDVEAAGRGGARARHVRLHPAHLVVVPAHPTDPPGRWSWLAGTLLLAAHTLCKVCLAGAGIDGYPCVPIN